jgi:cytochrome P450
VNHDHNARWRRLSLLLQQLERAFESASRLNAYDPPLKNRHVRRKHRREESFEYTLKLLEERVLAELDLLTAARLNAELSQRKRLDVSAVSAA